MAYLCTLAQARLALKTDQTAADGDLLTAIAAVSDRFEQEYPYPLEPERRVHTYSINLENLSLDGEVLYLGRPLLAVESITISGNTVEDGYALNPIGQSPATEIEKTDSSDWTTGATTRRNAIVITGYWGQHRHYDRAYTSLSALTAAIDDEVTELTVDDATGFSPGMLLRLVTGDDVEYLRLLAVDTDTDTLTVLRGVNGTVAVDHGDNADVEVYSPDPAVVRVVAKQAAYAAHRRGGFEETRQDLQTGTVIKYAGDLLPEVAAVLASLPAYTAAFPVLKE